MLEVKPVSAFQDNYIWLIVNPESGATAIVDPGDARPVLAEISRQELRPAAILITHHHPDHTGGITEILEKYRIPVYGPANEAIPGRTEALKEGDKVTLLELDTVFEILEVPGHTSGHIAYHGNRMLFIGDTLFMSGCGRLFEGTATQMHRSLCKLLSLPDDTRIYCAHEYTMANLRFALAVEPENKDIITRIRECEILRMQNAPTVPGTLAVEKKTNPFLRTDVPAVISAAAKYTGQQLNQGVDVFAAIRRWKDNF